MRKPTSAEPIREVNPWATATSNSTVVRSQTEPLFPAFGQAMPKSTAPATSPSASSLPPTQNSRMSHHSNLTNSASFSVRSSANQSRGDAWVESLRQDIVALKTGESVTSTMSGSSGKNAPAIPARTGRAAIYSTSNFNRNLAQNHSMRSPVTSSATHQNFIRSQSVRYVEF